MVNGPNGVIVPHTHVYSIDIAAVLMNRILNRLTTLPLRLVPAPSSI